MEFQGDGKIRTLIVEDSPIYRGILKECLEKLFSSITVEEASEGDEGVQKTGVFRPQIVFMDIQLPDGNGLDLIEKMKAKHSGVKVVLMTGFDSPEYREAAIRRGADGYIDKNSLNPGQVEKMVKSLLGK